MREGMMILVVEMRGDDGDLGVELMKLGKWEEGGGGGSCD